MKMNFNDLVNQKLSRFHIDFSRLLLGVSLNNIHPEEKKDLVHFKNEAFYKLAILFITIGLFPICYGAYMFFRENNIIAGVLELLSYLVILILLFSNRINIIKKRYIFVLCIFFLGLMLLFIVGPMGAGLIVIFSALGLAACVLDKRQNIIFIYISLLVFVVISVFLYLGLLDNLAISQYRESWHIVAISTQCMGTLFVLIINNLFSNIENQIEENEKSAKTTAESERSKSILISNLPGMAYRCDYNRDWTMKFVSDGCFKLTGYAPECLINNKNIPFNDLITPEYREPLWKEWERILAMKLPFKYEYEIMTARGEHKWVLELGEGVYLENGEVEAIEGIILDISDRKEMENTLRYYNDHDLWTGLYNRRYLEDLLRTDAMLEKVEKRAVVGINLSAMQLLSLTHGFYYSQELLKNVADALTLLCTDNRQLFNTYVNRFVFYVINYKDNNELVEFCGAVINALETVLAAERTGGGIGIIEIDEENKHDIDRLLKNLLVASEKAITTYDRDFGFCFYDNDMELQNIREEAIRHELVKIAEDENSDGLYLQFQPILDLKSNQICGFEALARLNCINLGKVPPMEFISIAEKTKLIIPLGKKIIIQAFQFLNRMNKNGHDKINVSINISAIQLLRNDFVENLFDMISEMQVNPTNIGIEITESIFVSNYEEINKVLGELKDIGIKILIDDFGTEYSSLARVRELNVNCLKIDKYFADNLLLLNEDEVIAADIISMAHKLGYIVVAEGVEHEKQRKYLKDHDCDKIQGYLIAKPLDEDVAIELINKQKNFKHDCRSIDYTS